MGSKADGLVKKRALRTERDEQDLARLIAVERELVAGTIDDLERICQRLPAASSTLAPQGAVFAEVRASGLIDEVQLNAYLKRMSSTRTKAQTSGVIGAAKELLEAVLAGALSVVQLPSKAAETSAAEVQHVDHDALLEADDPLARLGKNDDLDLIRQ